MHDLEVLVEAEPKNTRHPLVKQNDEHDRVQRSKGFLSVHLISLPFTLVISCETFPLYLSVQNTIPMEGDMMKQLAGLQIALVLVLVPACTSGAETGNNTQSVPESPVVYTADGVTLTIRLETDSLEISISAPTTGWVAVAFEPSRAMKDADICIGYVQGGEVSLRDDFGTGNTSHAPDTSLGGESSFAGLSGTETDGVTSITFTIPRNSGDSFDKVLTAGGSFKVLLGYGPEGSDDFTTYHRWVKSVDLTL